MKRFPAIKEFQAGFGKEHVLRTLELREAILKCPLSIKMVMTFFGTYFFLEFNSAKEVGKSSAMRAITRRTYRMKISPEADEKITLARRKAKRSLYGNSHYLDDYDYFY